MIGTSGRRYLLCLLFALAFPAVAADPYDGVYAARQDDAEYRLALEADGFGRYDGIFTVDGEMLGVEATRFGDRLAGRLTGPDGQARILIELRAHNLLLMRYEDGRTLRLLRVPE